MPAKAQKKLPAQHRCPAKPMGGHSLFVGSRGDHGLLSPPHVLEISWRAPSARKGQNQIFDNEQLLQTQVMHIYIYIYVSATAPCLNACQCLPSFTYPPWLLWPPARCLPGCLPAALRLHHSGNLANPPSGLAGVSNCLPSFLELHVFGNPPTLKGVRALIHRKEKFTSP